MYGYLIRILILSLLTSASLVASDWPEFRGPERNGMSSETGLLKSWPEAGPNLIWATEDVLGQGYASLAIEGDEILTTGIIENQGYLFCLNQEGKLKWKTPYGEEWTRSFPGTRATPIIRGDRVYLFSGKGVALCFNRKGDIVWKADLKAQTEADDPAFGWSDSGFLSKGQYIVTVGGRKATVVSLDAATGKTKWTTTVMDRTEQTPDVSVYSDSIVVERGGRHVYIARSYDKVFGIDIADGRLLWDYNTHEFTDKSKPIWDQAHPNAPLYHNGEFYISSGYNMGGAKFRLSKDGSSIEKQWENLTLDSHHHGYVLVDGNLYGSTWINNKKGNWASVNWKTGELNYDTSWNGKKGAIIYADGMLYCYEENKGNVGLVKATPNAFEIVSSFQIPKSKEKFHWAHPAISDGKLYIRYGGILRCFDIKEKS